MFLLDHPQEMSDGYWEMRGGEVRGKVGSGNAHLVSEGPFVVSKCAGLDHNL